MQGKLFLVKVSPIYCFSIFILYLCGVLRMIHNQTKKIMALQIAIETAVKMTILDAIEKGHTSPEELSAYMQSPVFEAACARYVALFNETM